MSQEVNNLVNELMILTAEVFETTQFDIRRPDYSSATTAYVSIAKKVSLMIEPIGSAAAQPKIPGAEHYLVNGDRNLLKPGDIIVPSVPHPSLPVLTVSNLDPVKDCVAIRTNRTGKITKSKNNVFFTNVNFDYARADAGSPPLNPDMEGSVEMQQQSAVLWFRAGIDIGYRLIDDLTGARFDITNISGTGNFLLLPLRESDR